MLSSVLAVLNREIIKINQDPLGVQGLRIKYDRKIEVIVYNFCRLILFFFVCCMCIFVVAVYFARPMRANCMVLMTDTKYVFNQYNT